MKNLLRAYKAAKDGNKKTGATPIFVPFEDEMEEIFGTQANISNNHTLSLRGEPILALLETESPTEISVHTSSSSFLSPSPPASSSTAPFELPSSLPSQPIQKKKFTKTLYFEEKIKYLKRKEQMKKDHYAEKTKLREERNAAWIKFLEKKSQ